MSTPNLLKSLWRSKLKQITPPKLSKEDIAIICHHPYLKTAQYIGVYKSIHPEINIDDLVIELQAQQKQCFLPVLFEQKICYRQVEDIHDIQMRHGFIPVGSETIHTIEELDCVIVPCLGLDLGHHRLGRGKGFFDRILTETTQSLAILAHAQSIPVTIGERHDCVIKEVIWF